MTFCIESDMYFWIQISFRAKLREPPFKIDCLCIYILYTHVIIIQLPTSSSPAYLHFLPVCLFFSNVTDNLHGNEIDLSGGACAKDNSFANILYGDIRKDNLKNINLDTKC